LGRREQDRRILEALQLLKESEGDMEEPRREIRSFVLRAGRMTDLQREAYSSLSHRYCLRYDPAGRICSPEIFGNENPLVVEIGFGMGFATSKIALALPGLNFVGIEVHKPGIGKLLSEIEKLKIPNLRIVEHDAVETIHDMVPDATAAGFNIFFPDPWPKKRHHKRRLLKPEFASLLSEKLAPGGYLYFVTDWEEYAGEALATLSSCGALRNEGEGFAERRPWRPLTKFELKAQREGRTVRELYFLKA
jgi:tRNA (guanine-N7-)-methyltransferase